MTRSTLPPNAVILKARRSWRAFSLRHHPSTNANATLRQPIAAHPAQPQVAIYSSTLWPRGRYSSFVGLRNFNVPKTRKYRCCIRIESAKENGQAKLVLFIKGRQVENFPTEKHTELLDCLHKNRGHLITCSTVRNDRPQSRPRMSLIDLLREPRGEQGRDAGDRSRIHSRI